MKVNEDQRRIRFYGEDRDKGSTAKQEGEGFHRWSCEKDPGGLKSQLVAWWLSSISPERR